MKAARGDLDAFAGEVEGYVGHTASSTARLQDFLDHGWERNRATIITYFQDQAIAAGESASVGTAHWLSYQAAVEAGNAELAANLASQAVDWAAATQEAATASADAWAATYTAQAATSSEATDEAIANTERMRDSMVDAAVAILASWQDMAAGLATSLQEASAAIAASLDAIPDEKVITITTVHKSVGGTGGGGVASPFGGGSQTKSTSAASPAPNITVVVPQDAVTDSVLRAAPGREALRGWA